MDPMDGTMDGMKKPTPTYKGYKKRISTKVFYFILDKYP